MRVPKAKVPFLQRYRTSRAIFQQAMALLGRERDLWVFPVLAVAAILVGGLTATAVLVFGLEPGWSDGPGGRFVGLAVLPLMFPFMVAGTLLQSALAFCLHERMAGRPATRGDGWRRAWAQRGPIVRFSLAAMLVAGVLQALGQLLDKVRLVPYLGSVVSALGSFAWAAATFFVIPVLVVERERHALGAIKASAGLARGQWGKATAGIVTLGLAMMVPVLVLLVLFMGFTTLAIPLGVGFVGFLVVAATFVLIMLGVATLGQAATTAYQVGLYRYARTGEVSGPFTPATLVDAWAPYRR